MAIGYIYAQTRCSESSKHGFLSVFWPIILLLIDYV